MTVDPGLGSEAKLYYNSADYMTPTWVEIDNVQNLTLDPGLSVVDETIRADGTYKAHGRGPDDPAVSLSMLWDPTDAGLTQMLAAKNNRTPIELLILDGPVVPAPGDTSQGLRGSFHVSKFNMPQPLDGPQIVELELKVGRSDNPPEWFSVTTP